MTEGIRLAINGYQNVSLEKILNWIEYADRDKWNEAFLKELKSQAEILLVERTVLK